MATIGRNDTCPCGSGKKYKKCCLAADEARQAQLRVAPPPPPPRLHFFDDLGDELESLSNSVIELVDENRFDDALAACKRLLQEFPEVVDGLERSGMVHAKIGNHALAADFYRQALAFISDPSRRNDYEDDGSFYREEIETLEKLAHRREAEPGTTDPP
jgi:tetratricopeptide (TPR) repeat protein